MARLTRCTLLAVVVSWMLAATTGPSPRFGSAMAYDSARHRAVLFGGRRGVGARTRRPIRRKQHGAHLDRGLRGHVLLGFERAGSSLESTAPELRLRGRFE